MLPIPLPITPDLVPPGGLYFPHVSCGSVVYFFLTILTEVARLLQWFGFLVLDIGISALEGMS